MQEKWLEKAMGATATIVKLIIINDYSVSTTFIQLLLLEIIKNHTIFWTLFFSSLLLNKNELFEHQYHISMFSYVCWCVESEYPYILY